MGKRFCDIGAYILGWNKICVKGYFVEELFNAVKREGIYIWNIDKPDQNTVTFKVFTSSLGLLLGLSDCDDSLCDLDIKVCDSGGFIEDLLKYKLRSGIIAGFLLSVVILAIMTSFIWKIEISGLLSIPEDAFLDALAENGIFVGALTSGHDFREIRYNILHDYENIAYVTVNMKGCKAEVEVDERIVPPELRDPEPCNLFAKRDGQIVFIETYQGLPQVKKYDAVQKGDLLVSGVYDSQVIGYRLVHADAEIKARTRRTYTEFCPFVSVELVETGKTDVLYTLKIFGLNIGIPFFNKNKFEAYDSFSEESELRLGSDVVLPISLVRTTVCEYKEQEVLYSEDSAKAHIESSLDELLRLELHGLEIESCEKRFVVTDDGVYGVYDMTVIENICEERKIEIEIID